MKIIHTSIRVYVNELDKTIAFYENLLGQRSSFRFHHPAGLELASVGNILIIAGTDQALETYRRTVATFKVDSIKEFHDFLVESGATILRGPQSVPTGTNMTVLHPDGSIFEYVEHH